VTFHIIPSPKFKLLYVPTPKCACTTMKHVMYFLEHGDWYQESAEEKKYIHKFYGYDNLVENLDDYSDWYKFAVVREPIDRFISFYQNKIVQEKKYIDPSVDIDNLAMNLEKYQSQNSALKHHTETQKSFLGDDLAVFDWVGKIEDLSKLHETIQEMTHLNFSLPQKQTSSSSRKAKLSLSNETILRLVDFYKEDYALLKGFYQVPLISNITDQ